MKLSATLILTALISFSANAAEKIGTLEMKTYTDPETISMILYRGDFFINNNDVQAPKCLRSRFDLSQAQSTVSNPDLYRAYLLAGFRVSKIVASKIQFDNDSKPTAVNFEFEFTGPNGKVTSGGNTICDLLK